MTEMNGDVGHIVFITAPAVLASLLLAWLGRSQGFLKRVFSAAAWFVLLGFIIGSFVGLDCCEGLEGNYFILYRHPSHLVAYHLFLAGLVAIWSVRKAKSCRLNYHLKQ